MCVVCVGSPCGTKIASTFASLALKSAVGYVGDSLLYTAQCWSKLVCDARTQHHRGEIASPPATCDADTTVPTKSQEPSYIGKLPVQGGPAVRASAFLGRAGRRAQREGAEQQRREREHDVADEGRRRHAGRHAAHVQRAVGERA